MHVFYEEDGGYKVATVKESQAASFQVEDVRGKRSKIKAANVMVKFERPEPQALLDEAQKLADEVDVDFLWEVCGEDEFGFEDIAAEYFGASPSAAQQAAVLLAIGRSPMYFYKKGRGRYKAAPEENLKAALAAVERKAREAEMMAGWQDELIAGRLPEALAAKLDRLTHRPDKNSLEYKALAAAAESQHMTPLKLLIAVGAVPDLARYQLDGFLIEHFPHGREARLEGDFARDFDDLPLADVKAFSIDDVTTTEIDDAFSLLDLGDGKMRVGIHIAAPTLGIAPDSPLDRSVFERLSTVYFPGDKITMLPDEVVSVFTLAEGGARPAVSLYLEVDAGFNVLSSETRVERVTVAANLRHDTIEPHFHEGTAGVDDGPDYPYKRELNYLYRFALALEALRGKSDPNAPVRLDYSFYVDTLDDGAQKVRIVPRKRGAPMDKLVAELAILVNSTWGKQLADAEVAAVYRTQAAGRVRMTTQPGPHTSLGVDCYAWSSSPLRRGIDFINQSQLVAMARDEKPRFARNDAELFAAIGAFDAAYAAYNEFQDKMERYWCLRYLEQEGLVEFGAQIIKENLVRIDGMPLVLRVPGLPELPAGSAVSLQRIAIDYLELTMECRLATI
ncbi:ribonuclease catalytic domain-containing protein [Chitinibacteraceae bacterium HSL-7]